VAEIELRPIERADIRSQSTVLASAFYDDPVMKYMQPDDKARAKMLPPLFATLTRNHFIARGGSEVASRNGVIGAATLWDPPGLRKSSRWEELKMLPTLAWHFRSRAEQTKTLGKLMEMAHPEEPHWYLMIIGSDPTVRGKGFGNALLRSRLNRCDGEHAPAYLEASKAELISYYQRFGFDQIGEIQIPDGPKMWPMWRAPR
jgi:ribosomal protein S18 acetylase RimI-like enzyme